MIKCFWCDKIVSIKDKTLDHIKPKALGGKKVKENLVESCYECNHERGRIVTFHFLKIKLRLFDRNPDGVIHGSKDPKKVAARIKHLNTLKRRLPILQRRIDPLIEKWKGLELMKLGYSPTVSFLNKE